MARTRDRPVLVWLYRIFLGLNFLSAVGFIVYALLLENPPKTALPLGMIIVGSVGVVSVIIGLLGSLRNNCCVTLYLWIGTVLTLAELGLTLALFFNFDKTVNDIWKSQEGKGKEKSEISKMVSAGRWFFLVVCCLQFVSILVAVLYKFCGRRRDFESFEDGENGGQPSNSQIQMQKLQASVSGRQAPNLAQSPGTAAYASAKLNKSTTQKMAAKYGEYSNGEFGQKGFFGRMFK